MSQWGLKSLVPWTKIHVDVKLDNIAFGIETRTYKTTKVPNIDILFTDNHFWWPKTLRLNHFRKAIRYYICWRTLHQTTGIKPRLLTCTKITEIVIMEIDIRLAFLRRGTSHEYIITFDIWKKTFEKKNFSSCEAPTGIKWYRAPHASIGRYV